MQTNRFGQIVFNYGKIIKGLHMKQRYKIIISAVLFVLVWACNRNTKSTETTTEQRKKVELVTNLGSISIELYNETPLHRDNFINLVRHKAYDSILFHRVINNFMIQAGDPESKKAAANDTLGSGDVPYRIAAEFRPELFHKKGVIAAARDGNPEKASSGMQFYIVQGKVYNDSTLANAEKRITSEDAKEFFTDDPLQKDLIDSIQLSIDNRNIDNYNFYMDSILQLAKMDKDFTLYRIPNKQREVYKTIGGTPHLDQGYTVFGEVVKGIAVLDSIAKVATDDLNRPIKDVRIYSIQILE